MKDKAIKVLRTVHRLLLMGEEGELTSWLIFAVLIGAYMGFSLALVSVFGTNVVLQYTRFSHDNIYHLYIPRTVIDNGPASKLANLGTVWLPLQHLAIMFLTPIDPLYSTGLAGSIMNSILTAATASTIYMIIRGRLGLLAALMYGVNMYSVIHASSSYMIPIGQFLAVASVYYFSKYCREKSVRALTKASALVLLATLARYEAWPMAIVLTLLVVVKDVARGRRWIIAHVIPAYLGMLGWLAYNAVIFGNPLEFITHPSPGAAGYYSMIISRIINPLQVDYLGIAKVVTQLAGPIAILAPLGVLRYVKERRLSELAYIVTPLTFLLAEGEGLLIADHPLYFYFTLPFIVIVGAAGLQEVLSAVRKNAIKVIAASVLVIIFLLHQVLAYSVLGSELTYATRHYREDKLLARKIISKWQEQEGYILCSCLTYSQTLSVIGGLSPRYIIDEYDLPYYVNASLTPTKYNVSVIVLPSPSLYMKIKGFNEALSGTMNYISLYYSNESWKQKLLEHYKLFLKTNDFYVLLRVK